MRRGWAVAALTFACGGGRGDAVVDAMPPTLSYSLFVQAQQPARTDPPIVFIDGAQRDSLLADFPDTASAAASSHDIELRVGSAVVATMTLDVGQDMLDCFGVGSAMPVVSFREDLCDFETGDLRYASNECETVGGVSVGDGFCIPRCQSDQQCGSGARCSSIVTLQDPLYSHVGCAPIGSAAIGSGCTFTAGSDGMYDDCVAGAVCVDGTCLEQCAAGSGCGSGSCTAVDGEPVQLCR
nr:hypothetical protein [Kofleriaceae bacterium]